MKRGQPPLPRKRVGGGLFKGYAKSIHAGPLSFLSFPIVLHFDLGFFDHQEGRVEDVPGRCRHQRSPLTIEVMDFELHSEAREEFLSAVSLMGAPQGGKLRRFVIDDHFPVVTPAFLAASHCAALVSRAATRRSDASFFRSRMPSRTVGSARGRWYESRRESAA